VTWDIVDQIAVRKSVHHKLIHFKAMEMKQEGIVQVGAFAIIKKVIVHVLRVIMGKHARI
jgi:hypothetical protein